MPSGKQMPIANIQIVKGRSRADRQKLIARVTDAIADCLNVDAQSVRVLLTEIDADNWGVAGIPKSVSHPSST